MKNTNWRKAVCLLLLPGVLIYGACGKSTPASSENVVAESVSDADVTSDEEMAGDAETVDIENGEESTEEIVVEEPAGPYVPDYENPVHGIYLSAYVAGSTGMMDGIIENMDGTAINAVVIDIKNDEGRVTWNTDTELVNELGSCEKLIGDLPGLVKKLHEHDIYVIGRYVTFREVYLKDKKTEWLIHNTDGTVYEDKKGFAWIDPTNEDAWAYIEEICKACLDAGMDEIQFDYVRYGTGITEEMIGLDGAGKQEAITAFASHMEEKFNEWRAPFSLDVFGTIISSDIDSEIVGQSYPALSEHTNFLSPMVYPSHYYDGSFGVAHPDEEPYLTISGAMKESTKALEPVNPRGGVRPWLQAFTASYLEHYIKYGGKEIRDQIKASYEEGSREWLLWNPSCKYPWEELTEDKMPDFDAIQEEVRVRREQEALEAQKALEEQQKALEEQQALEAEQQAAEEQSEEAQNESVSEAQEND